METNVCSSKYFFVLSFCFSSFLYRILFAAIPFFSWIPVRWFEIKSKHLSEFWLQFDEHGHFLINLLLIDTLGNTTRYIVVVIHYIIYNYIKTIYDIYFLLIKHIPSILLLLIYEFVDSFITYNPSYIQLHSTWVFSPEKWNPHMEICTLEFQITYEINIFYM